MRKRNVHIQLWLSETEAARLQRLVKRSGLSREAYLRHLIGGVVPQDIPPRITMLLWSGCIRWEIFWNRSPARPRNLV